MMNILAYVHLRNIHGSTGAGRVARNIIEALDRTGNDKIKILGDRADYDKVVPKVGAPWSNFDYRLYDADTSRQQQRWALLGSPKAEDYWPEAEVVYCTKESYVPARKARRVNLIHDAAFFDADALQRSFSFRLQKTKWRLLFQRIAATADMIQTVSHFSAERLVHHFPSFRGRMQVVHNAVSDIFFVRDEEADAANLARLGLDDRPYVLLPRGLAYRKNADLVLKAWPRLRQMHPDIRLVVTSHNDTSYVERAQAMGPEVVMTGFVSDEELRAIYGGAQLVWFPSRYEGFGMPVLEAMACGTAVVASNAASLPEIMGNAGLLVPPDASDHHVEALDHLLRDGGARSEQVRLGLEHSSKFTWDNSARTLRSALQRLI